MLTSNLIFDFARAAEATWHSAQTVRRSRGGWHPPREVGTLDSMASGRVGAPHGRRTTKEIRQRIRRLRRCVVHSSLAINAPRRGAGHCVQRLNHSHDRRRQRGVAAPGAGDATAGRSRCVSFSTSLPFSAAALTRGLLCRRAPLGVLWTSRVQQPEPPSLHSTSLSGMGDARRRDASRPSFSATRDMTRRARSTSALPLDCARGPSPRSHCSARTSAEGGNAERGREMGWRRRGEERK